MWAARWSSTDWASWQDLVTLLSTGTSGGTPASKDPCQLHPPYPPSGQTSCCYMSQPSTITIPHHPAFVTLSPFRTHLAPHGNLWGISGLGVKLLLGNLPVVKSPACPQDCHIQFSASKYFSFRFNSASSLLFTCSLLITVVCFRRCLLLNIKHENVISKAPYPNSNHFHNLS